MEHTETTKEQDALLKKINNGIELELYRLTDVATWLREVKGWFVGTEPVYTDKFHWECVVIAIPTLQLHEIIYADTHDLALSAGIDFILNKLNEDDTHPTT